MRKIGSAASLGWFVSVLAAALAFVVPASGQIGLPGGSPVKVTAEAQRSEVKPGDRLAIAVVLDHAPHYHCWPSAEQDVLPKSIADFAVRTTIQAKAAKAGSLSIGPIQWPEPKPASVPDVNSGSGSIEVPVYQGRAVAYVPVVVSADATPGEQSVHVEVSYQACNESTCLPPETQSLDVTLAVGATSGQVSDAALFAGLDASVFDRMTPPAAVEPAPAETAQAVETEQSGPVTVSAVPQRRQVKPGDQVAVAVVLEHKPGWHTWPSAAQDVLPESVADFAIRTEIGVPEPPKWARWIGPVQWPKPHEVSVADPNGGGAPINIAVYTQHAVAYLPVAVSPDAPAGSVTLPVHVSYQACNESQCDPPQDVDLSVTFDVVAADAAAAGAGSAPPALFAGFDPRVYASMPAVDGASKPDRTPAAAGTPSTSSRAVSIDFFGYHLFTIDPTGPVGIALLMLVAALGGFVLNLTPCVLPVIPIKIMGLSQAAANPGRCLGLGASMSAGVVAFWMAIGLLVSVLKVFSGTGQIFGVWWFTVAVGVFIVVMGLGMMGAFTVRLPQAVYKVNPSHDSMHGSFLFGVMTAVLGLPCFGPFLGAATAWAVKAPTSLSLGMFGAVGVGMALPYLLLSARPKWVNRVPRTGPASELVKQVMGLLLMAAGAYFLGTGLIALVSDHPYLAKVLHIWVVGILGAAAGLWLVIRTIQISKSPVKVPVFAALGIGIAAVSILVLYTLDRQAQAGWAAAEKSREQSVAAGGNLLDQEWVRYTPQLMEQARKSGRPIVVDFTAEWCINCKTLEAAVLHTDEVRQAMARHHAVSIKADLTSRRDPGWELLDQLGEVGIPLIAVFPPGSDAPTFKSNAYTPEQLAEELARAAASAGVPAPDRAAAAR